MARRNRKPQFDPNSSKARKLAAENKRRREAEAAYAAQQSGDDTPDEFADWTARAGVVARDFDGVGRVTVQRNRKYGTRKYHFTAQIRPHGGDLFAWHQLTVPANVRTDQRRTMAWVEQWAADMAAAEPTRDEIIRAALDGKAPPPRFVDDYAVTPGPVQRAVEVLLLGDGVPRPSVDDLPQRLRDAGVSKGDLVRGEDGDA